MSLPKWAQKALSENDLNLIKDAVTNAEKNTSGEIVPIIVRRSSTIGHVPLVLLCFFTAMYFAFDVPDLQGEYVGNHWAWYLADMLIIVGITLIFSRIKWVQRNLVSQRDREEQVQMRAELEFYESNIRNTKGATGILLFVSLLERRAVILADTGINEKVTKETWTDVCNTLVSGIRSESIAKGFCDAINKSQVILTPHFPIQPDDTNELSNNLIIKD